jgi:hypothetical protein
MVLYTDVVVAKGCIATMETSGYAAASLGWVTGTERSLPASG